MNFQTKKSQKVRIIQNTATQCHCHPIPNSTVLKLIPGNILPPHQAWRVVAQNKEKAVRIVSTGRQGRNPLWVSVEDEKTKNTDSGTVHKPSHESTIFCFISPSFCYLINIFNESLNGNINLSLCVYYFLRR